MSNGILALISGLVGGVAQGVKQKRERTLNEAYKKALIDQAKMQAKYKEQEINLHHLKMQREQESDQWLRQRAEGQAPPGGMPPQGMLPPGGMPPGPGGMPIQPQGGGYGAVQPQFGGGVIPQARAEGMAQGSPELSQIIANTQQAQQGNVGYQYGGKDSSKGAIDCSGWVCENLNRLGIPVSGSAAELAEQAYQKNGLRLVNDPEAIQAGTVLFTPTALAKKEGRFGSFGHTGIVVEQNGQKFVSESRGGIGPTLTPLPQFIANNQQIWGAPAGVYGQPRGGGQPAQAPQGQGQTRTPIDTNNLYFRVLFKDRYKVDPIAGKEHESVRVGSDGNFYQFQGNKLVGVLSGPPPVDRVTSKAPTGQTNEIFFTRPSLNKPSQIVGGFPTDPGPGQSVVPMIPKDREAIEGWQEHISQLTELEQYANNPELFGPKSDIYADLLTGKGNFSKIIQNYAGPNPELVGFRQLLENFNAELRSGRYGAALTPEESKNFQREAINARNPQEFLAVVNNVKKTVARKLKTKVETLSGTQNQYLDRVKSKADQIQNEQPQGSQQTIPVMQYKRNPKTGKLERVM